MKTDIELVNYTLEQIEELESFLINVDEETFLRDRILENACLMKLIVIGEYISRVSNNLKDQFGSIEWQPLKAARNFYIHAYGGINWVRVWEALNENLPALKNELVKVQTALS